MDESTRACSIEGCKRQHWSRGMCALHYQRWRRHGSADVTLRAANGATDSGCSATGCGYVDPHGLVSGLCRKHYQREQGRYHVGKPAIQIRPCAHCGEMYRPKRRDDRGRPSLYCSRGCKYAARRPEIEPRTCPHCGEQFAPNHASHFLCTPRCRAAAHRLQSKFRSRVGEPTRPGIWRFAIAQRDDWTCGICGELVDRTVRWPDPGQATLDHIVPVTRGGTNDPSNLRLAHMSCNRRRGNRMEAHASF